LQFRNDGGGKCNSEEHVKKTASLGIDRREADIIHAGCFGWKSSLFKYKVLG